MFNVGDYVIPYNNPSYGARRVTRIEIFIDGYPSGFIPENLGLCTLEEPKIGIFYVKNFFSKTLTLKAFKVLSTRDDILLEYILAMNAEEGLILAEGKWGRAPIYVLEIN